MNGKSRNSQKVPKLKLQDKYKHQSIPKIIVTDGIAHFATPGNNGNVSVFSAGATETNYEDGGQTFKFSVEAEDTIGDSDDGEQDSSGSDSDSLDDTRTSDGDGNSASEWEDTESASEDEVTLTPDHMTSLQRKKKMQEIEDEMKQKIQQLQTMILDGGLESVAEVLNDCFDIKSGKPKPRQKDNRQSQKKHKKKAGTKSKKN